MEAFTYSQLQTPGSGDKVRVIQVSDGTNTVDVQVVTVGQEYVVQQNATISASGSAVLFIGASSEVDVITNIKASPSGTSPTLTISIQDIDPGDLTTVINTAMSGPALTAIGTSTIAYNSNSGFVKLGWTIGGSASPTFTQTYISVSTKMQADARGAQRTLVTLYYDRATGVTTEALATMTINKNGVTSTATSYTVTLGRTLRLQTLHSEILNSGATANRTIARARIATSGGSLTTSSPVVLMTAAQSPLATTTSGESDDTPVPDGIDIPGGFIIGISHLENATTAGIASALLVGYES